MIRGTSHIFRFDCSDIIDNITTVRSFEVTFEQSNNNDLPIIKKFEVYPEGAVFGDSGCNFRYDTKEATVELTPEETVLCMEDRKLKVQLKGTTVNPNTTFADYIQYVTVYPMLSGQHSRVVGGVGSSTYVLPVASSNILGGVKLNPATSNITMNDGLISVTSKNVADALSYTPANTIETVYVGENAPNNANIQVWVNPTEESSASGIGEATFVGMAESSNGVNLTNTPKSGTVLLGSAASKFVTSTVRENDSNLITSGGVYKAVKEGFVYATEIFEGSLTASRPYKRHIIEHEVLDNYAVVARSEGINGSGDATAPVMVTVVRQGNSAYGTIVYVSTIPGISLTDDEKQYRVRVQIIGS